MEDTRVPACVEKREIEGLGIRMSLLAGGRLRDQGHSRSPLGVCLRATRVHNWKDVSGTEATRVPACVGGVAPRDRGQACSHLRGSCGTASSRDPAAPSGDAVARAMHAVTCRGVCCHFWRGQGLVLLPLSPAVGTRWDGAVPGGWKGSGHVPMSPPVLRAGGLWVMCEDGETGLCVSSPAGCGGATHIPAGEGAGTGQSVSLREGRMPQAQAETPHVPPGDRVSAVLWGTGGVRPQGEDGDTTRPYVRIVCGVCTCLGYSGIQGWGDVTCSEILRLTGGWGKAEAPKCAPPALGRDRN